MLLDCYRLQILLFLLFFLMTHCFLGQLIFFFIVGTKIGYDSVNKSAGCGRWKWLSIAVVRTGRAWSWIDGFLRILRNMAHVPCRRRVTINFFK